jgi:hypothetical protein
LRSSVGRIVREGRDRLFIRNWSRLHQFSTRFHVPLPQFMYNTSVKTFAALAQYREQPLPIRLTLVRASDAREVEGAGVACGWDRVAQNGVDVQWAPGSHETMFVGKNLEATAALLRASLETPHGIFTDGTCTERPERTVALTSGCGAVPVGVSADHPVMSLAGAES